MTPVTKYTNVRLDDTFSHINTNTGPKVMDTLKRSINVICKVVDDTSTHGFPKEV